MSETCASLCLQKLHYELSDCALWEFMFPSNDKLHHLTADQDADADPDGNIVINFVYVFFIFR